jgi:hypothetical protein
MDSHPVVRQLVTTFVPLTPLAVSKRNYLYHMWRVARHAPCTCEYHLYCPHIIIHRAKIRVLVVRRSFCVYAILCTVSFTANSDCAYMFVFIYQVAVSSTQSVTNPPPARCTNTDESTHYSRRCRIGQRTRLRYLTVKAQRDAEMLQLPSTLESFTCSL